MQKDVQLKQALNDQLKSNLNKTNNTAVTIKESTYISKCINANNSKKPLLEPYVQLCISIKHNDILKEITVDVNEFDSMLTIMQIIKQYCTK